MIEFFSESQEVTRKIGEKIAQAVLPNDILALYGELGAGKTILTQGIAMGLGISEILTSPSFVIINEYKGRLPLFHIDLYRLDNLSEIKDLGIEEYFEKGGLCVVEWAERAEGIYPERTIKIEISILENAKRKIVITGKNLEKFERVLKGI